jgi:hypothetical protein
MNERIRQLAKDAGYYLYDLTETHQCKTVETDSVDEWITLDKFSELILKECMDICDSTQAQYGQYTFTATTVKNRIKERFGVEE